MTAEQLKTLVVVGTRPEAIKLAPVIKAMQQDKRFECVVCATGQHREMLYPLLEWFGIEPDYHLDVMKAGQPLSHLAGKLLHHLHDIIEMELPDIVVVQGDTTSAFMGAVAAHYGYDHYIRTKDLKHKHPIRVAHVEAGLRTYDMYAPYPEEGNRRLIGPLAYWHFAPTLTAAEALYEENITANVFVTGNTVIDALYDTVEMFEHKAPENPAKFVPEGKRIVLITGHRRENYGDGFHDICDAIKTLAAKYQDVHFVYPVHLNQNVQGPVRQMLGDINNVHLINPLPYPEFVAMMQKSHLILTDSGGVQEEAPSLGKPVLVMREVTERPEAVIAGTVKVVGHSKARIVEEVSRLLEDDAEYKKMSTALNPYGDGMATQRILNLMAGEVGDVNTFKVDGE